MDFIADQPSTGSDQQRDVTNSRAGNSTAGSRQQHKVNDLRNFGIHATHHAKTSNNEKQSDDYPTTCAIGIALHLLYFHTPVMCATCVARSPLYLYSPLRCATCIARSPLHTQSPLRVQLTLHGPPLIVAKKRNTWTEYDRLNECDFTATIIMNATASLRIEKTLSTECNAIRSLSIETQTQTYTYYCTHTCFPFERTNMSTCYFK